MRIVLGIDPGLDGGAAVLDDAGLLGSCLLPTMGEMGARIIDGAQFARWIADHCVTEAVIERVHAMPKQGVSSTFKFGVSFGQLLGIVQAALIPYTLITPQQWKKHYRLLKCAKDDARMLAIAKWPGHSGFHRKKDLHRAEAALLAQYHLGG